MNEQIDQQKLNEIFEMVRKLDRARKYARIWGALKLLLFLIPLIISISYARTLYSQAEERFAPILNMFGSTNGSLGSGNIQSGGLNELLKGASAQKILKCLQESSIKTKP